MVGALMPDHQPSQVIGGRLMLARQQHDRGNPGETAESALTSAVVALCLSGNDATVVWA